MINLKMCASSKVTEHGRATVPCQDSLHDQTLAGTTPGTGKLPAAPSDETLKCTKQQGKVGIL